MFSRGRDNVWLINSGRSRMRDISARPCRRLSTRKRRFELHLTTPLDCDQCEGARWRKRQN